MAILQVTSKKPNM